MLQTPVLMIVFNRPETTQKVFAQIRKIKPRYLFIAADGPRAGHPDDVKLCEEVRKIVTAIDWDCELKTLFRDENLGCGKSVSGAINWFFQHVEEGIILEDDCLPSLSFFGYCEELLQRYREHERVFMIGGFNYFKEKAPVIESYYFSRFARVWGWATWKRAWKHYRFEVPEWHNRRTRNKALLRLLHIEKINFLLIHMRLILSGRMNAWAPQWWFYMLLHDGLCILPAQDLIVNIGFSTNATHTWSLQNSYLARKQLTELQGPLIHPQKVEYNIRADRRFVHEKYGPASFFKKMHWKYQQLSFRIKSA